MKSLTIPRSYRFANTKETITSKRHNTSLHGEAMYEAEDTERLTELTRYARQYYLPYFSLILNKNTIKIMNYTTKKEWLI